MIDPPARSNTSARGYHPDRRLALLPLTARIEEGPGGQRLSVAGHDLADLARRYGTPLYLYDQATMDAALGAYRRALAAYPAPSGITYAAKAFLCLAMGQWVRRNDLWLDCTGTGEMAGARAAGVARKRLVVHGVNKSPADLAQALAQAGTLVVDSLVELKQMLAQTLLAGTAVPNLWLRLRPGLAVDTHAHTRTGQQDSKFGLAPGEVGQAVQIATAAGLNPTGLHFHQGSHFRDPAPLGPALDVALDLIASLRAEAGWLPDVLCPGGGWGVAYHEEELPGPLIEDYVNFIVRHLVDGCRRRGLPLPHLRLEPGRSLVARAGVALYRVGVTKVAAGRRWLLLDGGLADNPRPALYGTRYTALPVREPYRPDAGPAWLGGPYCESGDILIHNLPLPELVPGELIAVPVSGAYQLSMASNYNGACRPAVVWLRDDGAHLVQAREMVADLYRRDQLLPPGGHIPPGDVDPYREEAP